MNHRQAFPAAAPASSPIEVAVATAVPRVASLAYPSVSARCTKARRSRRLVAMMQPQQAEERYALAGATATAAWPRSAFLPPRRAATTRSAVDGTHDAGLRRHGAGDRRPG